MNVHTKRWARPLALFIALTMIMMYSFGGVVYADLEEFSEEPDNSQIQQLDDDNNEDKEKENKGNGNQANSGNPGNFHLMYDTGGPDIPFYVTFTYDGKTYKSGTTRPGNSGNYSGDFGNNFPAPLTQNQLQENMVITILGSDATVDFEVYDAHGQGTINIKILKITYPAAKTYDLKITKVADNSNVTIGSIVTFTITAKNVGNTTITGVTVADIWTNGLTDLTVVSMQGNSFTTNGATGTWDIGTIGPNGSEVKSLVISAKASGVGTATNTAIGYLNETDFTPTNEASAVVQISNTVTPPEKTYDLVINKEANHNTATKGSLVTFTITAKNAGNTTITGVTVADIWTDGLTEIELVSQNGSSFNTTTGIWTVGDISPNNSETKTLVITAKANTVGTATNTAVGYLVETETGQGSNIGTTVIEITESTLPPTPKNDLAVTKSVNLSTVTVGTGVVFTIVITNTGDTTLQAIEVKDIWPSGLTLGTTTPDAETSFTTNGNIWVVGTLAPNASKTLTIAAGTPTAGTYTNNVGIFKSGEVSSPLVDDNLNNNTAAAIVTVTNPGTTGSDDDDDTPSGTTTTITPTPTPLAEIPETETPLVEAPEVTLEEQPIPLADVPQTGDNTNIWLLLALMMGSGAGIVLLGRRKETVEK